MLGVLFYVLLFDTLNGREEENFKNYSQMLFR